MASTSILNDVKKILNISVDDYTFDSDIILHINTAFSFLNQLGIGPTNGFSIENYTTTWDTYLGTNANLNAVKTYVCLRVRMVFDPPTTSYMIDAMNKQIQELEFRLNVVREATEWVNPLPVRVHH